MPSPKQMEKMAEQAQQRRALQPEGEAPEDPPPASWWQSVLDDPRASGRPRLPITQLRLNEIPRPLLRVSCLRCSRVVEIQTADAIRLHGPHAIWKDVGQRLLDDGCRNRTGRHEEDGCWPDWSGGSPGMPLS
ncbi:hypothetical protein [Nitrobacter sp.]|uniref:hypothetical protein n=1 Tax=Nitrobacter sp. TaxID=29420 RepID=UPI002608E780|nr:hypothetical protein [Nitrobacter sp.]